MGLLNRLRSMVPGFNGVRPGLATAGDRGRPSTDEKVPSSWTAGVGGRVWFLPYADNTSTGDSPEIRAAMRLMLRDPWIKAAWLSQVLTVLSQDFQVHHPDARHDPRAQDAVDFVRHCIESADGELVGLGTAILMNLGSDGFSLAEKVWGIEERHPKYKGRYKLRALKPKNPDMLSIVGDEFKNVTGVKVMRTGADFPISDFTYTRYLHTFDEPFGMAAFRAGYGAYWMRDTVRKLRVIRIEKADGLLIGEYEDPADKGPLEAMLARAKISTWASIPVGVKVSAIEKSKAAEPDFKSFDESLREESITSISFASLHILQGNVADGRGDTKVHKAVSDLGPWLLTYLVQLVLNRQVIPDLIDYNFAGLTVYPRVTLGGVTNQEILEQLAVLEKAQARGFNPSRHHYATASTIQEADPQDPTDQLVPPAPPPMPGFPGAPPAGPQPPDDPLGGGSPPFAEPPKPPAPVRTFADAWAPFTGPKGGQGWKNGATGEVRYQKGKPSEGAKAEKPAPGPAGEPKEPWEMSSKEATANADPRFKAVRKMEHAFAVEEAYKQGKAIPDHVQREYKDRLAAVDAEKGKADAAAADRVKKEAAVQYVADHPHTATKAEYLSNPEVQKNLVNEWRSKINTFGHYVGADEYVKKTGEQNHRDWVASALANGKPVKPEVLADYPDIRSHPVFHAPPPAGGPAGSPTFPVASQSGTLADGTGVRFVPHESAKHGGTQTVMVDPKKLDAEWAKDEGYYIPPGGGGAEVGGRRDDFSRFLATGQPVQAPRLALGADKSLSFEDGRHRFAVLRDKGIDRVPVTVREEAAGEVRRRFGVAADPVVRNSERFAWLFAEPLPTDEVALAGKDGKRAAELLRSAKDSGRETLARLAEQAVGRMLADSNPLTVPVLFTDAELKELADSLSATTAAADLLGRSRVHRMADHARRQAVRPMAERFAEGGRKYGFVGVELAGDAWQRIRQLAAAVEDADLADDGRESDPHVTARYGLHTSDPDEVARCVAGFGPVRVTVGGAAAFLGAESGKPYDVLYLAIESPDLYRLHAKLGELPHTDTHPEYRPHATIAYVKPGLAAKYLRLWARMGPAKLETVTDFVEFSDAKRNKSIIPLVAGGAVQRFAEAPSPFAMFDDFDPIPAVPPTEAIDYFRKLVPSLDLDPLRYGPRLDRHAFTLAAATDEALLGKVKGIIQQKLETGVGSIADVQDVLDQAGVTSRNPQYAEAVMRTNVIESYNQGQMAELERPEIAENFPAWEYHAVVDNRARPTHAARNSLLYPSTRAFADVRGTEAHDVVNCRCSFSPVYKTTLAERITAGEKVQE